MGSGTFVALPRALTMSPRVISASVLLASGLLVASCSSSPTSSSSTNTSSITITGTVPPVGQSSQLTATATLANGTTQNVTTQASWSSSNTAVATVGTTGLLTVVSLALGSAQITATYQSASGQLSVTGLTITSLIITGPTSLTIPQPVQLTALAKFSDGSMQDVTSFATWGSTVMSGNGPGAPWFNVNSGGVVTPLQILQNAVRMVPLPAVTAAYNGLTATAIVSIALPCQFTSVSGSLPGGTMLTPTILSFSPPSTGGMYAVVVQAPGDCAWTTVPIDDTPQSGVVPSAFATVTAGGSGTGNGVISFSIAPNFLSGAIRIIPAGSGAY